jgi:hypothetical protein
MLDIANLPLLTVFGLFGAVAVIAAISRKFQLDKLKLDLSMRQSIVLGSFGGVLVIIAIVGFVTQNYIQDERLREITALKSQLDDRDAKILTLETQLGERDAEMSTLKTQLDDRDAKILTLETQLGKRDAEMSTLKTQLDDRDAKILTLETQLGEHDAKLVTLQTQLGERDKEILALKEQIQTAQLANPLEDKLSQGDVQFEWQWAGENWYGRMTLEKQGTNNVISQATVGLMEKTPEDRILMDGQVLDLAPGTIGTFEITDDGIKIKLTVEKKSRHIGIISLETITGTLQPTLCYAGRVSYSGSEGPFKGEMILVQYISQLGIQVDDWFENKSERDWFVRYLIDR